MAVAPAFFAFLVVCVALIVRFGVHKVEEGHVGVYWKGGALTKRITEPGIHVLIPFYETTENVQVTIQTDKVTDIPCGTSGGVIIRFEKVEVVNRLRKEDVYMTIKNYTTNYDKIWIFDKIHHEINQFCSKHTLQEVYIDLFHTVDDRLVSALQEDADKWAPGVQIIAVRLTKPTIPATVLKNYESMEAEKTKLLIAQQSQKVTEKEAETDRLKASINANKEKEVSAIRMSMEINEKSSYQTMKKIEDETHLHHEKTLADAEYYKITRQAEANKAMLTQEYLQLQTLVHLSNNTKVYFGPSIQAMYLDFFQNMLPSKDQAKKN